MSAAVETPWGPAQTTREIAPGIMRYDTASHGGYWLSPERVAAMPEPLRNFKPWADHTGPGRWYEEDCDWAVVALAFPQFFPDEAIPMAVATLKRYKPELYQQMQEEFAAKGAGEHWFTIHYADRELAREMNDPVLGIVQADDKDEAETIARKDADILSRAKPCASLWAVRVRDEEQIDGEGMTTSNETRAERAKQALHSYVEAKGEVFEASTDEVTDLVADLLHLAAHYAAEDGGDAEAYVEKVLRLARIHFDAEHENPEEDA